MIEAQLAESRQAGLAAAERAVALSAELTGGRAAVAARQDADRESAGDAPGTRRAVRIRAGVRRELRQQLQRRETELARRGRGDAARPPIWSRATRWPQGVWQQVAQLQTQWAAQLEALQSMEGRRGIFDSMLRGLDLRIGDRDQEQRRLAADLARIPRQVWS